ncbi:MULTISPECIES: trypsin-like peptidase domain-containing protein [Vagococcus]|uniref:Serine protease, DegP/HtrA, do-like n=2 Tax=Vagococcus fluvialis TaxID=2738 RepID=A0A1X6WPD9_9ENTE|nr:MULTISPECIES: trypsin-like peptidase domain-containing protein [Vagococcus]SLM86128.1 Serine protease, DegP/HtrA, do-like [Vagococcus fluvialis bH819]HCM90377.1 PDZ domain-containing protein [Vagococcus sp.]
MRKDVTPENKESRKDTNEEKVLKHPKNKKNNAYFKQIGVSLLAGALGGLLVVGGYTVINKDNNASNVSNTRTLTKEEVNDTGKTKVQNTKTSAPNDVTGAVKKMENAVVSVTTMKKQQSQLSDLEKIFGPSDNNKSEGELAEASEGSGVIYRKDGDKAYIVTNNHVVTGSDAVNITFSNGKKAAAKVVGTDVYSDLAVLEISSKDVTNVAEFADSNDVQVGEAALAMGSPLGSSFSNSVSQGIVSAKDRMITNQAEDGSIISSNAIQTDAAINPGNSGGALVNSSGQVIGINSSKIAQAASGVSAEGMGFAIPSNDVVKIINQLETGKPIARPMLGVSMRNLDLISPEERESVLKLKPDEVTGGIVIVSVEKDSPAEKGGLKKYDVITQLDGKDVSSSTELQSTLYNKKIGDDMEITYYRNGKKASTKIKLDQDSSKLLEKQQQKEKTLENSSYQQ